VRAPLPALAVEDDGPVRGAEVMGRDVVERDIDGTVDVFARVFVRGADVDEKRTVVHEAVGRGGSDSIGRNRRGARLRAHAAGGGRAGREHEGADKRAQDAYR